MMFSRVMLGTLVLVPVVQGAARRSFESSSAQRSFSEVSTQKENLTPVASLSAHALFSPASDDAEGRPHISLVGDTSVALLDCSGLAPSSRDLHTAFSISSGVVCDVLYQDLVRQTASLPLLQAAFERMLLCAKGDVPPQKKKTLYVAVLDCSLADASSVQNAALDLIDSTWADAAKPMNLPARLSDYFEVKVTVLPHRRRASSLFPAKLQSFLGSIENSALSVSSAELTASLESPSIPDVSSTILPLSRGDAVMNSMCEAHLKAAYGEFLEGFPDLTAELGSAVDNFGELTAAALDQATGTFDALASSYEGNPVHAAKRRELQARILGQIGLNSQ